jgi:hypothetical protein
VDGPPEHNEWLHGAHYSGVGGGESSGARCGRRWHIAEEMTR